MRGVVSRLEKVQWEVRSARIERKAEEFVYRLVFLFRSFMLELHMILFKPLISMFWSLVRCVDIEGIWHMKSQSRR